MPLNRQKFDRLFGGVFLWILKAAFWQTKEEQQYHGSIKMAYHINSECIACGACEPECPTDAIIKGEIYKTDEEECIECGACADICPVTAISPDD